MLTAISKKMACRLSRAQIIEEKTQHIYAYGIELMLSSMLSIGVVILLSILCGHPLAWMPFLLAFIPLRLTAGGYHAKTHAGCCTCFAIVYLLCMGAAAWLMPLASELMIIWLGAVGLLVVLWLSPVASPNKPLSVVKRKTNRKRSIMIVCVSLGAAMLVVWMQWGGWYTTGMYFLGEFSAISSLIAGIIIKKRNEKHEKQN